MAKYVIFLLLGVALASAAPGLPESPPDDIEGYKENGQHAYHHASGSSSEQTPYTKRENETERQFFQRIFKLHNMTGHEEVVLVLGNTGGGKTTVASLLGGVELTAIEVGGYLFNISDEKQLIRSSSTPRISSRINVFTDVHSNTTFYDLPGFGDSDMVHYFTPIDYIRDKTFPFTNLVKILLVISESSVQYDGSGGYFLKMLDKVARLVNDVERYGDAIAMVVNKVSNNVDGEEGEFKLTQDKRIIDDVASFLNAVKNYLEETKEKETDEKEKSFIKHKIELIKVLLKRSDKGYERIGLLRRPMEAGLVSEMKLLMEEKENIKHIVNKNLKYAFVE